MCVYSKITNDLFKEFSEISGNYADEIAWFKNTFHNQDTGARQSISTAVSVFL